MSFSRTSISRGNVAYSGPPQPFGHHHISYCPDHPTYDKTAYDINFKSFDDYIKQLREKQGEFQRKFHDMQQRRQSDKFGAIKQFKEGPPLPEDVEQYRKALEDTTKLLNQSEGNEQLKAEYDRQDKRLSRFKRERENTGSGKYEIVKEGRDGYKVCVGNKCYSKKPLPLERAKAQQKALYASENKKKGEKLKELELNPDSGTFTMIAPAGAIAPGSLQIVKKGTPRAIALAVSQITGQPATSVLTSMPSRGTKVFGNITVMTDKPELSLRKKGQRPDVSLKKMEGQGLFDWLKKAGSAVVSGVKTGLSKIADNVASATPPQTDVGDKFFKEQTKLFSPSGREDEPGIPPQQVIQNFRPNPLMPDTKILYQMNKNAYANSNANIEPGWSYMAGTPTIKIYNKGQAMVIAVRGTADNRDILTDLTIAAQDMQRQPRYTQDRDFIRQFQTQYPPGQYTYLLTGHSLGGAICDQLMRDGIGEQAITFNPAVQKNSYDSQNNKRIYQSEDPLYRMMGRYCKYNVEVRQGRGKSAIETALSYVPVAGVGYTAMQAHSLDNYVGGMLDKLPTSVQDRPHLRTLVRPF